MEIKTTRESRKRIRSSFAKDDRLWPTTFAADAYDLADDVDTLQERLEEALMLLRDMRNAFEDRNFSKTHKQALKEANAFLGGEPDDDRQQRVKALYEGVAESTESFKEEGR